MYKKKGEGDTRCESPSSLPQLQSKFTPYKINLSKQKSMKKTVPKFLRVLHPRLCHHGFQPLHTYNFKHFGEVSKIISVVLSFL